MPGDAHRRISLDANVLLAYVGNEDAADVVETSSTKPAGIVEVVTFVLTIAEVAYGAHERDAGLTEQGEALIDVLWQPGSPITLVDVSQATAREARRLIAAKTMGVAGLRSIDAMHLASARLADAGEIFTYENATRRQAWHELTELPVSEPTVASAQLDFGRPRPDLADLRRAHRRRQRQALRPTPSTAGSHGSCPTPMSSRSWSSRPTTRPYKARWRSPVTRGAAHRGRELTDGRSPLEQEVQERRSQRVCHGAR